MRHRLRDVWDSVRISLKRGERIESGPGQGLRFYGAGETSRFIPGKYELPVQESLSTLVQPGDVCYDIGANLGFFSLLLARFTGTSGVVYAFEPLPANGAAIRQNAKLNGFTNVNVMELAVSSEDGRAELMVAEHLGGAVLDSVGVPPPDLKGTRPVMTASIDSLIARGEIRRPNVCKIDVEGAELQVLRGMEGLLREHSPRLLVEVDDADRRVCEEKQAICIDFLESRGFEVAPLAPAYPDTKWVVRHFTATRRA